MLYEMDALSQIEMSPGPALVPCLINISLPYENRKLSLATDIPRCCGCGTSSRILHQKNSVFLSAMDKAIVRVLNRIHLVWYLSKMNTTFRIF